MKSDEQILKEFQDFVDKTYNECQPQDVDQILPGLENYKNSFLGHCLAQRDKLHLSMVNYVSNIEPDLKQSENRIELEEKIYNIGTKAFKNFTDNFIKGRTFDFED